MVKRTFNSFIDLYPRECHGKTMGQTRIKSRAFTNPVTRVNTLSQLHQQVEKERKIEMDMENGSKRWRFRGNEELTTASTVTVKGSITKLRSNLNESDQRPTIPLGRGDPSAFPCFRTTTVAPDAVVDAVKSAQFNCYSPAGGIVPARR